MKKAFLLVLILMVSVISTACINNMAIKELNSSAQEYFNQGDYENAIQRLKASIELDDSIFETHYNLATIYEKIEDYNNAIAEYEKAVKINPESDTAYYALAVSYENQAKKLIEKSKQEDFDDASAQEEVKDTEDTAEQVSLSIPELFKKAVENYNNYLDLTEVEDKTEVGAKISYLNDEIAKYSDEE